MKYSFLYKLIMAISTRIYTYYCKSYTSSIINRFYSRLKHIYQSSLLYRCLSINTRNNGEYIDRSIIGKIVTLINKIIKFFKDILIKGIDGSKLAKIEKSVLLDYESKENRVFFVCISFGLLITYNALKLINGIFTVRTIIFDGIILIIILNILLVKIGTTLSNSMIFRLAKGFVIQPRGDMRDE